MATTHLGGGVSRVRWRRGLGVGRTVATESHPKRGFVILVEAGGGAALQVKSKRRGGKRLVRWVVWVWNSTQNATILGGGASRAQRHPSGPWAWMPGGLKLGDDRRPAAPT